MIRNTLRGCLFLAVLMVPSIPAAPVATQVEPATLVVTNGTDRDDGRGAPEAQAIAVRDDRIVALGTALRSSRFSWGSDNRD